MKTRRRIQRIAVLAAGLSVALTTWPQLPGEGDRLQQQRSRLSVDATTSVGAHVIACCSRGEWPPI
jgi:hypothetical protein